MASGQVGRLSVRVLPDTTGFRQDLKKVLDRAEKSVTANIDAVLNLTQKSLANVKSQLEGLEATIPVSIRDGALRADLQRTVERLESSTRASLPVEPERATEWRAEIERMIEDIENQNAEFRVVPDVDSTWASGRMRWLTRDRFANIIPTLDAGATAGVATALAALSGGRILSDLGRGLRNTVSNIDRVTVRMGVMGAAISNVSSLALAGTSNLLSLGASLASIVPAALALPGIFTGFGVGLGTMVAALKDAGTVLADLGPQFSALQDTISGNFWAQAEAPIRNLATNLLPILQTRLGDVANELGLFFGSMANAASSAQNLSLIDQILANTSRAIDIAGDGIAYFMDAIIGLGAAGASYLPALAGWFNRISESFSAWVNQAVQSGQIFDWIDTGIAALQDLGSVVWGIGGVFSNLARAATAAGGATLGSFAAGLQSVNAALEGPIWQGALTTVFQGAHDAVAALGPGVSALGDAFLALAPTLSQIMVLGGQIGSVALAGIAAAFQHPAFQGGLVAMFQGVLAGVQAIAPAMPALGAAFGAVASFAGTLARVLGPVLGVAIQALAPIVTSLMSALSAIAPVLGGVLVAAIQAVAPFIQRITAAIAAWVQQHPGLAAGIAVAVAAIGGLIAGAVSLIAALAPVITSIIGVVAGLSGLGISFGTVGTAIAGFLATASLVVGIVAAIAGALIYAWNTSEQFRTAVASLGAAIMGFLAPVIAFIQGTVIPVVTQIVQSVIAGVQRILAALTPMMTVIIQIAAAVIARLTPIITFILGVLAPVFTFLGSVVSAAFTFISTVISQAINIITSILQVFLAVLRGDWSAAWAAIRNVASTVWTAIKTVVSAGITLVRSVISSGLSAIRSIWTTVWNAIRGLVSTVLSAIVSFVTGRIAAIRSAFSSGMAAVRSGVSSALSAIRSVFSSVLAAIVGFVTSRVAAIRSRFSSGLNAVRSVVSSAMNTVRSTFSRVLSAIVGVVRSGISRVVSGFRNMGSRAISVVRGFIGRFRSVGSDLVRGLINGITNMAGNVAAKARDVVSGAVDAAKSALGIASPSKVFMEIGEYTGDGMVKGLDRKARDVNASMTHMVQPPRLPSAPGAAGGVADGRGLGVMDLSDDTIMALAEAVSGMKIVLGQREFANAVRDAGSQNRRMGAHV